MPSRIFFCRTGYTLLLSGWTVLKPSSDISEDCTVPSMPVTFPFGLSWLMPFFPPTLIIALTIALTAVHSLQPFSATDHSLYVSFYYSFLLRAFALSIPQVSSSLLTLLQAFICFPLTFQPSISSRPSTPFPLVSAKAQFNDTHVYDTVNCVSGHQ